MDYKEKEINFNWKKTLIISLGVIAVLGIGIYYGIKSNMEDPKENINLNAEKVEPLEEKLEEPTIDFNQFSNEQLVNFVNDANEAIRGLSKLRLFNNVQEKERILFPMIEPYDSIEKRKEVIDKYYINGVFKEKYTEYNGETYVEEADYENFKHIYTFEDVISREVKDNVLVVKFKIEKPEGFSGVSRTTKIVEFKGDNGKLKLNSKQYEDTFLNFAENPNDEKGIDYNKKEKEMFQMIKSKLSTVLRADQKISSISSIYVDPKSGDQYYGISVKEPTQNAVCFYLNKRTGAIYGHYQKRFVA